MKSTVAKWVSVVYAPFNIREAMRMLDSDMPKEAIKSFLEGMVASWPTRGDIAVAAFRDVGTQDAAVAVEFAGREIAQRVIAEMEPHA